jgi:hypothetical protein
MRTLIGCTDPPLYGTTPWPVINWNAPNAPVAFRLTQQSLVYTAPPLDPPFAPWKGATNLSRCVAPFAMMEV